MKEIKKRLFEIEKLVRNHLTDVAKDISEIKTDLRWVKKFFWLFAGAVIVGLIGALFNLILK